MRLYSYGKWSLTLEGWMNSLGRRDGKILLDRLLAGWTFEKAMNAYVNKGRKSCS